METYWSRVLSRQVNRRRALAVSGGTATAAALFAACGGGSSGSSKDSGKAASGLVTQPVDTFKQAKRGGTLGDWTTSEPRNLDPVNPQADLNDSAKNIYSTLFVEKPAHLEPDSYELRGDLAESFETSADGLQITAKIRPGVKFHNIAPVNGRALDMQDIIFSYERFADQAPLRSLVANSASPDGPVLSMTAPDSRTIVLKLKEPVAYMANWFASYGSYTGQILIVPKETDGTFDIRQGMIGTGPFFLKSHSPSVDFQFARNPDYWDKDFALVDGISMPIIPDTAQRLAQLRAGRIHVGRATSILSAPNVTSLKRDEPNMLLYETDLVVDQSVMTFGHLPAGKSKFSDERVRQAVSMAFDRDLYIDVLYNADQFVKEGLPVRRVWNSHLAVTEPYLKSGFFIDPQGSDFGPNAKYFKRDLTEAKKLLSAAGYPNGFEMTFSYPAAPQFDRSTLVVPWITFFQELGLKVNQNGQTDYTTGYIPQNRDANGEFEGIAYHSVTGGIPTQVSPTSALVAEHLPSSGVTFHGYDVNGKGDKSGDPALIAILAKARVERDLNAQKKLVQDAQRYLAKAMHSLPAPGAATGFWAAWPAVQNFRVWDSVALPWDNYQLWLDQTKKPFV